MYEKLNPVVSKKVVDIFKEEYINDSIHTAIYNNWRETPFSFKVNRIKPIYLSDGVLHRLEVSLKVVECYAPAVVRMTNNDGAQRAYHHEVVNKKINNSTRSIKIKVNRAIRSRSNNILHISKHFGIQGRIQVKTITWEF